MRTQKHFLGVNGEKGELGMDVASIVMILILIFLLESQKNSNGRRDR